ncbi:MAG: L-seryl-tRNA(Sec) selenium transferase [Dehalococcoidia bacterium]
MQLRNIPSVEAVIRTPGLDAVITAYPREWVIDVIRETIAKNRQDVLAGEEVKDAQTISIEVENHIQKVIAPKPREVINATGVIIHTNLGRAPLSKDSIQAAMNCGSGYSDLELDLQTGKRGGRLGSIKSLLTQLTGAEDAVVVNNNAAALLLALSALCLGREVIVPRSEAIEIGGGFRIPDVLSQSGAKLVDIGTTNRTYIQDYRNAITEDTGAFLKAHSSNFVISGFIHEVGVSELSSLGQELDIPVMHDVGSGAFMDTRRYGLAYEPTPQSSVSEGADLVFFSGDKLLGGPQAGIIVGKAKYISILERHPMMRAIRMDKLNLAALGATLAHYIKNEAESKIPVWQMISATNESLMKRIKAWEEISPDYMEIFPSESAIGGGSLPGETIPTVALKINAHSMQMNAMKIQSLLREFDHPIVARIENDDVIIDPRTILPESDGHITLALQRIFN